MFLLDNKYRAILLSNIFIVCYSLRSPKYEYYFYTFQKTQTYNIFAHIRNTFWFLISLYNDLTPNIQ